MKLTRSEIMETVSNEHNNRSCERFCSLENAGCQFSVIKAVMVSQHITYGWLPKGEGTKACRRIVESPYGTTLRAPETRRKLNPFARIIWESLSALFSSSCPSFLNLWSTSVPKISRMERREKDEVKSFCFDCFACVGGRRPSDVTLTSQSV